MPDEGEIGKKKKRPLLLNSYAKNNISTFLTVFSFIVLKLHFNFSDKDGMINFFCKHTITFRNRVKFKIKMRKKYFQIVFV